ncbi:MAG: gliding motility protein GldC [Bacteroidia bacterium]|jgi:gliding motility-associated protein GldC|nr:gliding motility protein GldC [Bacteroidia bacterium]
MPSNKIILEVITDEKHVPETIRWEAPQIMEKGECKSIALALWDGKENNTLRMDVWTKDMTTDEMKKFLLQSIITFCDTYERATSDSALADKIKQLIINIAKEEKVI